MRSSCGSSASIGAIFFGLLDAIRTFRMPIFVVDVAIFGNCCKQSNCLRDNAAASFRCPQTRRSPPHEPRPLSSATSSPSAPPRSSHCRGCQQHLGGKVEIFAKREDMNRGLAFGGNKMRKLEYLVPEALAEGCDTLVTIGGVQSNHTRQVAAVAAKLGMKCRLVQESWVNWHDAVYDRVGNILMSRVLGAHVELVDEGFGIGFKESWENALEDVRRSGRQALRDPRRRLRPQARRPRLRRLRRGSAGAGEGPRLPLRLHLHLLGHRQHAGRHGGRFRRRRPCRSRHRHRRLGNARGDQGADRPDCAAHGRPGRARPADHRGRRGARHALRLSRIRAARRPRRWTRSGCRHGSKG